MKRSAVALLALTLSALPLLGQEPVEYRFEQVRRKVTVATPAAETRASAGSVARGGDRVRTGWFGYALLGAPRFAARFEVFAGSDVRLASETPGVILTLERGRLKAMFDKITGEEPRMVKTPGALLAVRGTRYGIEVGSDGAASLVVFEGTVEVRSALQPESQLVHAGEACHFSRTLRPETRPMPRGMTEGMWQRHGSGMGSGTAPRDGGMGGMGGTRGEAKPPRTGSGHHGH